MRIEQIHGLVKTAQERVFMIRNAVWEKLLLICGLSEITALTRLPMAHQVRATYSSRPPLPPRHRVCQHAQSSSELLLS
jgi:hypothetical protein